MAEGRKPLGRITVRNKETKQERTIGKLWPEGTPGHDHPKMGMSLGEGAFGDRPAISQGEALALINKATTKGSGYFLNLYLDREKVLEHLGGLDAAQAAEPEAEPEAEVNLDEVPF